MKRCRTALLLGALALAAGAGPGGGASAPRLMPVLGTERSVVVEPEQTLLDIAFENRLGFEAVARLNDHLDPWIPDPGEIVRLPTRLVLPDADPVGLVVNVPEMRLYDFTVSPVEVVAAAIGDQVDPSILGDYRIGAKRVDPAWRVPASIRAEKPELPEVVPPGPENPLGSRWMTIGDTPYGIHGTNIRWSIGRMATHGCIRLYEDAIVRIYDRVPSGTRVQLVYQPLKWGADGDRLYLEAHPDIYGRQPDRLAAALRTPRALGLLGHVDVERAWSVVEESRGVPVPVGLLPAPAAEGATSTPPS